MVFDTVGEENLSRSFEAATRSGTVVTTAARSTCDLTPMHSKGLTLHAVFILLPLLYDTGRAHHGNILGRIATMADAGEIQLLLDEDQFEFEEVAAAHRRAESGNQIGKVTVALPT